MTSLLDSTSRGTRPARPDGRRPVVLGAALAGVSAAASVLVACMAVALAAWFATDQGAHGTTRDALRIGSDAWLLAHGAHLDVGLATITVIPLGLTALSAYVCFRMGRWAAATSAAEDLRAVQLAAVVMAGVYGLVAIVVALLASLPTAQPQLGLAFLGGFLVAAIGGGPGLLAGSGHLPTLAARIPDRWRPVLLAGASAALLVFAASALLVAVSLGAHLDSAATVLSRLHVDGSGAALYTVVVAAVAPNAALFGASYVAGPGFAVGAGTSITTGHAVLGPLPAFPLLAALPSDGAAPWWTTVLLGVPVLAGIWAGHRAIRTFPRAGYYDAAVLGLAGGALGAVVLGVAVGLSGGAVGPDRMSEVGAGFIDPTIALVVSLGIGATLGAVVAHWRFGPAPDGTEPTVDLSAGEPTVEVHRPLLGRLTGR
jgi:Family of unknown function (DUF6350)